MLSGKVSEGNVLGLDTLQFGAIKTKSAVALISALGLAKTRRVLIVIPEYSETIHKSTRNLPGIELRFAPNFSVRDALTAHKIVLVREAVAKIEAVWTPNGDKETIEEAAE